MLMTVPVLNTAGYGKKAVDDSFVSVCKLSVSVGPVIRVIGSGFGSSFFRGGEGVRSDWGFCGGIEVSV